MESPDSCACSHSATHRPGCRITTRTPGGWPPTFISNRYADSGRCSVVGHGSFQSEAFAQDAFQSGAFQGSSSSQMFLLAINADLSLEAAGSYEIILNANGTEIKRIEFEVVLGS